MQPLTDTEKAYFDTIKAVATGARPADLSLIRLVLDGQPVAIVAQRIIRTETAEEVGWHPLALLLTAEQPVTRDLLEKLRNLDGEPPESHRPDGLEGA